MTTIASVFFLAAEGGDGAGGNSQWLTMLMPFAIIAFLFYFLLIRPQKGEQARRQAMLAAIKKNDRVVTIGGIYGVVFQVQKDQDEVTLKIDETTNTKIRVQFGAIAKVIGPGADETDSTNK